MIIEDYCSYEVAKLLNEKGFDEKVLAVYIYDSLFVKGENKIVNTANVPIILAPTHQSAMKWLREKHIIIVVQPEYFSAGAECSYWGVDIWEDDNYEKLQGDFPAYEQAVEAALKYCLENLI